MTLRFKILALVGGTLSLLVLLLFGVTRSVLLDAFRRAEARQMELSVAGTRAALEDTGREFAKSYQDWAAWDDAYAFTRNGNAAFIKSNLTPASIQALEIDFLAFVDEGNRVVWSQWKGRSNGSGAPIPPSIRRHIRPGDSLLRHRNARDVRNGWLDTSSGPMLVATLPVHDSNFGGPKHGTLLVGRLWNQARLQKLAAGQNLTVRVRPLAATPKPTPASVPAALENLLANRPANARSAITVRANSDSVAGFTAIRNIYGQSQWTLEVRSPRTSTEQEEEAVGLLGLVLGIVGLLACLLALWPLETMVLRRLSRLSNDVRQVRRQRSSTKRIQAQGRDELSRLARDINATFEALEHADSGRAQSEALHREMAQTALTAGDCFFVVRRDSALQSASPTNADSFVTNGDAMQWHGDIDSLLGYLPGTFRRGWSAWCKHVHPEDRPILERAYERAWRDGAPFELEIRVMRADGDELFWMHRGKLVRAREGEEATLYGEEDGGDKLLGACLDITARKSAEAARQRTEARLARIAETAADAIMLFDADGQVTFANDAAATMFGRPVEELWSRCFDDPSWNNTALDGSPLPREQCAFLRVQRERAPVHGLEHFMRGPLDEPILVSINAAPLPDERGQFAGVVASFSDISERRALQERLSHQAFHDALTGLANRSLLRNRLDHALTQLPRHAAQVGVIFIDLDNFKWVNDSLGHEAGDELLCEVANRLKMSLRAGDTAARFGGDEFVVLLGRVDASRDALGVASRMLEVISQPFHVSGRDVFTSPSIGLAFGDCESDAETLLRHADAAMYEAKRRGKGRIEVFQDALSDAAMARLELETDLRSAVQNEEFYLEFQPKFDLHSGLMCGVEALLRWNHPRRGLISPAEFIPIAEESGLIVPLGRWILREACARAVKWNVQRAEPLVMAVNVSARQFHSGSLFSHVPDAEESALSPLVQDVTQALDESGLAPHLLVLELTEAVLSERTQSSIGVLGALHDMGVRLAIDDFGTGTSSLSFLRAFPFDFLKIDGEFVAGLDQPGGPGVIVGSIITLAHALGVKVIAEGAERIEEVEHLKNLDCDYAQGHFFSAPLSGAQLEQALQVVVVA